MAETSSQEGRLLRRETEYVVNEVASHPAVLDTEGLHRRAVMRLALTATEAQQDSVLGEFRDFVRTVCPETGAGV